MKKLLSGLLAFILTFTLVPTAFAATPAVTSVLCSPKKLVMSGEVSLTVKTTATVNAISLKDEDGDEVGGFTFTQTGASASSIMWASVNPLELPDVGTYVFYIGGTSDDGEVKDRKFTVVVSQANPKVTSVKANPSKVAEGSTATVTVKTNIDTIYYKVLLADTLEEIHSNVPTDPDTTTPTEAGAVTSTTRTFTFNLDTSAYASLKSGKNSLIVYAGYLDNFGNIVFVEKGKTFSLNIDGPKIITAKSSISKPNKGDMVTFTVNASNAADKVYMLAPGADTPVEMTFTGTNAKGKLYTIPHTINGTGSLEYTFYAVSAKGTESPIKVLKLAVKGAEVTAAKATPTTLDKGGTIAMTVTANSATEKLQITMFGTTTIISSYVTDSKGKHIFNFILTVPADAASGSTVITVAPIDKDDDLGTKAKDVKIKINGPEVTRINAKPSKVDQGQPIEITIITNRQAENIKLVNEDNGNELLFDDSLPGGALVAVTSSTSTTKTWKITIPTDMLSGVYVLSATAMDAQGETSQKKTTTITVRTPESEIKSMTLSKATPDEGSTIIVTVKTNFTTTDVELFEVIGGVDTAIDSARLVPSAANPVIKNKEKVWTFEYTVGAAGAVDLHAVSKINGTAGGDLYKHISIKGSVLISISPNLLGQDETLSINVRFVTNKLTQNVVLYDRADIDALTGSYTKYTELSGVTPLFTTVGADGKGYTKTVTTGDLIYWDVTFVPELPAGATTPTAINLVGFGISGKDVLSKPFYNSNLEVHPHAVMEFVMSPKTVTAGHPTFVKVYTNMATEKVKLIYMDEDGVALGSDYVTIEKYYPVDNDLEEFPLIVGGQKIWNFKVTPKKAGEYTVKAEATSEGANSSVKSYSEVLTLTVEKRKPTINSLTATPRATNVGKGIDFYIRTNLDTNFIRMDCDELSIHETIFKASDTNVNVVEVDGELRWVITYTFTEPGYPYPIDFTCGYVEDFGSFMDGDDDVYNTNERTITVNLFDTPAFIDSQASVTIDPDMQYLNNYITITAVTNQATSRLKVVTQDGETLATISLQTADYTDVADNRIWNARVLILSTFTPGIYKDGTSDYLMVMCGDSSGFIEGPDTVSYVDILEVRDTLIFKSKLTAPSKAEQGETINITFSTNLGPITDIGNIAVYMDGETSPMNVDISEISSNTTLRFLTCEIELPEDVEVGKHTFKFVVLDHSDETLYGADHIRTVIIDIISRPMFLEMFPFQFTPNDSASKNETIIIQVATTINTSYVTIKDPNGNTITPLDVTTRIVNGQKLWKFTYKSSTAISGEWKAYAYNDINDDMRDEAPYRITTQYRIN